MSATQQLLRFGVFEINLATEELRKAEAVVKLPPQPLRLLILLAGHAPQVVTREEIQQQFWGEETEIDFERRMNQCIKQIRTALGDNAGHPLYIETIHRQGYRFIAPVEAKIIPAPQPRVVESDSSQRIHIPTLISRGGAGPATVAGAAAPSYPLASPDEESEPAPKIPRSDSQVWRVRLVAIGVVLFLAGSMVGVLHWRAHKPPVLTEKDTIVLADFDNRTGDPVFDDTLKQALAIQLEQSPFLNVLSDLQVGATLKLMSRPGSERLTEDVAREVCLRANSKAMLTGSIVMLGSQYVIGLKAVDCATGDTLAETQEQAAGKEAVLKALDAAAVSLRGKLGESLSSVQKYATPLIEATTPSLEALKSYSMGRKMSYAKGPTAALPFHKRAVELDPNFARAYAAMSNFYFNLGESERAAENARQAYQLRNKVSEPERFFIEAIYYMDVTGELDKAAETCELWLQTYPRDYVPYAILGFISASLGNQQAALDQAREALRLEPNRGLNYSNLGSLYTSLNRLDEAEAVYQQAELRNLHGERLLGSRYLLAFLHGDTSQMARSVTASLGNRGTEDLLLGMQANTEAWYGRLKNARELTRRAMDSARANDAKETAATYQASAALREVESGNWEQGRADAHAVVKLAPNRDVEAMAALSMARAGDTAAAKKVADQLGKTFPLDTLTQRYWLPTIQAAIALRGNDPNRAIEILRTTSTIELGQPGLMVALLYPVYLRGESYLMLHDGSAAAAEFKKFIDHRGMVGNFPLGALAHLGLARAYIELGNTMEARVAYEEFLTLWKDADPDIPIYKQAKAESARLR